MWTPPETGSLQETCDMQHEFYVSLVQSGFTKHEAMHLMLGEACCEGDYA
jgi:hypothetical protein